MERKLKTREGKMIKSMYCACQDGTVLYRARIKVKPTNVWVGCCVGTYSTNCALLSSTRVVAER